MDLKREMKRINCLKRRHNTLQEDGRKLYARLLTLRDRCVAIQGQLQELEGDDYDPIPLLFGSGFEIDE